MIKSNCNYAIIEKRGQVMIPLKCVISLSFKVYFTHSQISEWVTSPSKRHQIKPYNFNKNPNLPVSFHCLHIKVLQLHTKKALLNAFFRTLKMMFVTEIHFKKLYFSAYLE